MLEKEGLALRTCEKLKLENIEPKNEEWEKMIFSVKNVINKDINIAIVGKYVKLEDSYISVIEAVKHGGFTNNTKVNIEIVNCENINNENAKMF